jgi:hypothetical protein
MGWMKWAAVSIRSLVPRRAVGTEEAEITEAVTIQLDDSEDSSFFGHSLVDFEEGELSERTATLDDLPGEDDIYLDLESVDLERAPDPARALADEAVKVLRANPENELPEKCSHCDESSFSEPTVPLHDLFDEDDEDLGLALGPERDYTTLSEQTARALANEQRGLSFDSLITLSDEAAKALGQHSGDLSLNRLTRLSYAAAKALGQHTGYLSLWGLTKLSGTTARALAEHKGGLSFGDLSMLSDQAAKALAEHKGSLCFRGLSKLSEEAAKALAQHEGGVHIWNPATISDEVAKTLRANPRIFLPEKFW